jgi:hypothetical protein
MKKSKMKFSEILKYGNKYDYVEYTVKKDEVALFTLIFVDKICVSNFNLFKTFRNYNVLKVEETKKGLFEVYIEDTMEVEK